MPDLTLWGLFVVASVVLLLTPGPAVLYIVARSVEQGRAAGLVSVLGIHLGTTIHITAAAVGLSAFIVSSALAFALVKYFGAAYLIWIGSVLSSPIRRSRAWRAALADFILGLTFMGLGIISDGMFALAAGTAGDLLRRNRPFLRFQRWFAGSSFIGLGFAAALATRK